jgi:hypothetical protein
MDALPFPSLVFYPTMPWLMGKIMTFVDAGILAYTASRKSEEENVS